MANLYVNHDRHRERINNVLPFVFDRLLLVKYVKHTIGTRSSMTDDKPFRSARAR